MIKINTLYLYINSPIKVNKFKKIIFFLVPNAKIGLMTRSDFMIHGVLNGFDELIWSFNLIKSLFLLIMQ